MTMDKTNAEKVSAAKTKPANQQTNGKPKEKRRSNEKRKEKSRDAARCRRSKETEIYTELAQVLPLPKDDVEKLDKASVMRVAIAYLKIREMLQLFPKLKDISEEISNNNEIINTNEESSHIDEKEPKPFDLWHETESYKVLTQTLDGFLLILSNDGDVTYVSENISEFLGISKIDMLGQQIWEYSHQCDHDEIKEALNIKKNGLSEKVKDENLIEDGITTDHRDFFIRLKCTLTSRGRSVNIKSASYKVIHMTGHLVVNGKGDRVLIAVGRPIPHPSNIEIPLGTTTFLTKHSLDMKFTYVDEKMDDLLGYKQEDLLDKSLYECHHGGDSDSLIATFKCALSKGQGETCRYRFLGKCGGFCWLVTQATIVYDKQKPQSVVCVNYVISNLENNHEIYSLAQYEASQLEKTESKESQEKQQQQQTVEIAENKPKPIQIQEEHKKPKEIIQVDLDSDLVPELSNKTCVDVDEKKTTSAAVELHSKREITINNINNNNNNDIQKPISEQIKYVPRVTHFRSIQNRPDIFGRVGTPETSGLVTNPPKFVEEKRPKSVTASVFRLATEKPIVSNSNTIILNQINLPPLNVAPRAQSVTASVFTPISQLRSGSTKTQNQQQQQQQQQQQAQSSIQTRAVEMNKGYLSFAGDTTGLTMLKEEPDDLAHLAPPGVDACLRLDENTPLFGEMLAGLMSYGGLLPDDINSLDSQNSGNQTNGSTNNKGHIDPFINYREESNDTNCSQHLLSPGASKSPEASSLPSLCSPSSLSQEDDFPFMTMNVDDEIDLSMRAPYIPMNEQDDLPLLTDDLMWGVGFASEDLAIHKDDAMQFNTLKQQMNLSTNSRLLNSHGNNNNNNNCHNLHNMTNCSPSASPMSISSSSAASSPSPCSPNSSISMHNQQDRNFGGAMLCNRGGGGCGSGGGGDCSRGGSSCLSVDDSDSGISSINSMSPQHTHQQHRQQQQSHHLSHNQHQQQNHQQSPMSIRNDGLGLISCKKEIDGGNLCESIDAFESVYNKDSTSNLDCWTVQELLNINSSESGVAIDNLQQTKSQQNIIINTATMPSTTLQVPLITIQNNKNISMNQQQHRSTSSPSGMATTTNTLSTSNCNNSSQNEQCGGNLLLNEEIIQNNRKYAGKLPTSNTAATIRVSNGNIVRNQQNSPKTTILQSTNLTALHGNIHKRHSTTGGACSMESKRLKNSSNVEIQTSPHLLQQLMAPAPQKQRVVVKMANGDYDKSQTTSRWNNENGGELQQQLLRNQQNETSRNQNLNQSLTSSSSNSVLKNLLISGCDNTIAQKIPEIMITDEEAICELSPCDNLRPLRCETSTIKVMRDIRSNPLICGPGILPSPPFPTDDSDPPGLVSDNDCSSDSGIEDRCTPKKIRKDMKMTSNTSTNRCYSKFVITNEDEKSHDQFISNSSEDMAIIEIEDSPPSTPKVQSASSRNYFRKTSISFMDSANPLMTSCLMDLCNDDYHMAESEFLEDNDLVQVLHQLTNDLV